MSDPHAEWTAADAVILAGILRVETNDSAYVEAAPFKCPGERIVVQSFPWPEGLKELTH